MTALRAFDMFCGAGGSSTGMARACAEAGVDLQLTAVNHWDVAIATHTVNHPGAKHRCVDVDHVRLDSLAPEGVDVLWASPSCTEHSYAKGGKSIDDQKRASAWAVPRAVEAWRPKVVIVENVQNMLKWGPTEAVIDPKTKQPKLDKKGKPVMRPIKARAGEIFRAWFAAIEAHGYSGKWELLNAADYGEAQTRVRLFIVFTQVGYRFQYPAPTHGKPGTLEVARGLRQPWKAAREIIDFERESTSIFTRGKPLSPNTMRRIEAGVVRYCSGPIAEAFLVILRNYADAQGLTEPVPCVVAQGQHLAIAQPEVRPFICGNRTNNVPKSIDGPIGSMTTTTGGGFFLAEPDVRPYVVNMKGQSNSRAIDAPAPTITAHAPHLYVAEPEAFVLNQGAEGTVPRPLDEPIPTVRAGGGGSVVEPTAFVLNRSEGGSIARDVAQPIPTVRAAGGGSVVEPIIVEVNHSGEREPRAADEPLGTITGKNGFGVAEPFLATYYGEQGNGPRTGSVDDPIPTIPCDNRFAVVEPFIVPQDTGANVRSVDEPVPTIRTTSRGVRFVQPFLAAHFGEREGQAPRTHDVDAPLPTVTHRGAGDLVVVEVSDEDGNPVTGYLVEIDGARYVIDIKFRMLQPEELARAQGFPDDYDFTGTKEARTAQIGNAVPVKVAYHLMRSALRCIYGDGLEAAA